MSILAAILCVMYVPCSFSEYIYEVYEIKRQKKPLREQVKDTEERYEGAFAKNEVQIVNLWNILNTAVVSLRTKPKEK